MYRRSIKLVCHVAGPRVPVELCVCVYFFAQRTRCAIFQDLEYLSSGLEGRSSNPVALLFDALTHPDADTGLDCPSLLEWRQHKDKVIPHVVLGKRQPGGAWQVRVEQQVVCDLSVPVSSLIVRCEVTKSCLLRFQ